MTKNDMNFDILMKLAVNKYMEDEIALFDSLDVSEVTVSDKTRRKFTMALRRQSLRNSAWLQMTKRVAVACLVFVTVLFASAMCIQPVRAAFWNAIVTWYEEYIGIVFEKEEEVEYPTIIEERILPESLPNGWTIEVLDESIIENNYLLIGQAGESILYKQSIVDENEIWYDNTECKINIITIHEQTDAYWICYADGSNTLTWKEQYVFTLAGLDVSKEILVEIAEAIE